MKANMGSADRIIRIIIGILIGVLYFTNVITGTIGLILLILGIVFILTALVSFCPLYLPFKINTSGKKN
ncbi:MAG TPA: DUF2892 domain-containing protein [Bacteroidales bacterium]|nr:DUF2892 domain-containing protein [Bacteroidales bacterium]HPE54879.1 DUF2892 domain-containing protein [Bacteroidales bacterium]HRX97376.1 DUF2892 domain-containing protein [Bacteroidales bacterium]